MSDLTQTQYGFDWGPFKVTRVAADACKSGFGWVLAVSLDNGKRVEIRATPAGRDLHVDVMDEHRWPSGSDRMLATDTASGVHVRAVG